MKKLKNIFLSIISLSGIVYCDNAVAQLSFSDDFDNGLIWNDIDGTYMMMDEDFGACNGKAIFGQFYYGFYESGLIAPLISPSLGVSNGGIATLQYEYKISHLLNTLFPIPNDPDWGTIKVEYANSPEGPWNEIETISPENHTPSVECSLRTITFVPEADSEVFIRYTLYPSIEAMIDGEFLLDNVVVTQAPPCTTPAPNEILTTQGFCNSATISDLNTAGFFVIQWYADEEGGEPLAMDVPLSAGVYYAAQISEGENGCESILRTAVTVNINTTEAPEVTASQEFCNSGTIEDLDTDGFFLIKWYTDQTGGSALATNNLLSSGLYYASQVDEQTLCESIARTPVTVTVNTVTTPEIISPQVVENSDFILLYSIEADAEGTISWYANEEDAKNGENVLPQNTDVTDNGTYYATQTINGCESDPIAIEIEWLLNNDSFSLNKILYYPNPVKNILHIVHKDILSGAVIYNVVGQEVGSYNINSKEAELDVSYLANGSYILKVMSSENSSIIKIIKAN